MDGDGKITVIAGAAIILFALIGLVRRPASGVMIALVLIASGVAASRGVRPVERERSRR